MSSEKEIRIPSTECEYEIRPVGSMRKIEKRKDVLESTNYARRIEGFTDKMFDITELNQKIIDNVVQSNHALREDLAVLIGRMENLTKKIDGFMDLMNNAMDVDTGSSATKEALDTISKPLVESIKSIADTNRETNDSIIQSLNDMSKTIRRMQMTHNAPPQSTGSNILSRRRQERENL